MIRSGTTIGSAAARAGFFELMKPLVAHSPSSSFSSSLPSQTSFFLSPLTTASARQSFALNTKLFTTNTMREEDSERTMSSPSASSSSSSSSSSSPQVSSQKTPSKTTATTGQPRSRLPRKQVLEVTEAAAARLRQLLEHRHKEFLRIGIKTRGCNGLSYTMNYAGMCTFCDFFVFKRNARCICILSYL